MTLDNFINTFYNGNVFLASKGLDVPIATLYRWLQSCEYTVTHRKGKMLAIHRTTLVKCTKEYKP